MNWIKQNWIIFGLVALGLIVLFVVKVRPNIIGAAPSPSSSPVNVEDLANAIKRVESEQPSRVGESPTEAELYNNPFIKHIRVALNGYLDGSNQGIEDPDYIINGSEDMPNCGLKKFDKSYYQSKFIVLNASDNDYGGVQADIVFVNKPDTIFWAWVYGLRGGEEYTLRGFCSNGPTEDTRAEFMDYIKEIIKNSKFSL